MLINSGESISNFNLKIIETGEWLCSESHSIHKEDKKRYFNCLTCKRYIIGQPSYRCNECHRYYIACKRNLIVRPSVHSGKKRVSFNYCLDCKDNNEVGDSGTEILCILKFILILRILLYKLPSLLLKVTVSI